MNKTVGGILLVAGTTIGGGMLSLPISTAKSGFLYSTLLFIVCWALMTFTAFLTLEVNLCFPKNSHMISMAKHTLGKPGAFITCTAYLLLLYCIVSAYIAGGQDVFQGLLQSLGFNVPAALCGVAFVIIFGSIVTRGVRQVDLVNRLLMLIKMGAIFFLIIFISESRIRFSIVVICCVRIFRRSCSVLSKNRKKRFIYKIIFSKNSRKRLSPL